MFYRPIDIDRSPAQKWGHPPVCSDFHQTGAMHRYEKHSDHPVPLFNAEPAKHDRQPRDEHFERATGGNWRKLHRPAQQPLSQKWWGVWWGEKEPKRGKLRRNKKTLSFKNPVFFAVLPFNSLPLRETKWAIQDSNL